MNVRSRRSLSIAALALTLCLPMSARATAPALSVEPAQPRSFCPTCKPQPVALTVALGEGESGPVHVALKHRAESLSLPTGFPFMQGATLFEGDFMPEHGAVTVTVLLPIRGEYLLSAEAKGAAGAIERSEQVIAVKDAREMVLNFRLMVLILLGLGLGFGYIFGRRSLASAMAVLALLALAPASARAHGGEEHGAAEAQGSTVQTVGAWTAHCLIDPSPASVGSPASIQFHLMDAKGKALKGPFAIGLDIELSEDEVIVYHADTVSPNGAWSTRYGFFDGSEHKLSFHVRSLTGKQSADFSFETGVAAHQPPDSATHKAFGFLMGLFVAGLAGGLALGRSRSPRGA